MSAEQTHSTTEPLAPLMFRIVKWYGYIFALMFLLYGGLKLVLGALDRDYSDAPKYMITILEGVLLLGLCLAFRDRKRWGWYGLVGLNGLIALLALVTINQVYSIPYLVLSGGALALLFSPTVKEEIF